MHVFYWQTFFVLPSLKLVSSLFYCVGVGKRVWHNGMRKRMSSHKRPHDCHVLKWLHLSAVIILIPIFEHVSTWLDYNETSCWSIMSTFPTRSCDMSLCHVILISLPTCDSDCNSLYSAHIAVGQTLSQPHTIKKRLFHESSLNTLST